MKFSITDMSCNHCVQQITRAVIATDAKAIIQIDIASKTANITTTANAENIANAITNAGYTPILQNE